MNSRYGKVGWRVNWDSEEQKLSDIILELSSIVYLIWCKLPRVILFSLIEASKLTRKSSLG